MRLNKLKTLLLATVIMPVPFSSQAPFGQWSDPKQEAACEETSVIMAQHWVTGKSLTKQQTLDELKSIFKWEQSKFGTVYDTSPSDTAKILTDYYKVKAVEVLPVVRSSDIIKKLDEGEIVLVQTNGRKLHNPHYTAPGPERHMLVVRGYDGAKKVFITNDPGTRFGESYAYKYDVLTNAIADYPTGHNEKSLKLTKSMIVVKR